MEETVTCGWLIKLSLSPVITLATKTFISLVKTFQLLLPHLHRQELVPLSLQKGRTLSQLLRVNLKTRMSLDPKFIEQV